MPIPIIRRRAFRLPDRLTRPSVRTLLKWGVWAVVPPLLFVAALWLVPLPGRVAPQYATAVYSHEGVLLRAYMAPGDVWRFPVDLNKLPAFMVPALLAREDKRFYAHFGVDPAAIGRAFLQNMRSGHVVSGGSTITMQLARLLEPRPRTLSSKIIEVFRAMQLELQLSKRDILRLYLTYAPYGGNIEGIAAASQAYFGHRPSEITPGEAAILLLLPQSPSRWERYTADQWRASRARVLDELVAKGVVDRAKAKAGKLESVPRRRLAMPMLAPHFADTLHAKYPDKAVIDASLSVDIQRLLKRAVARIRDRYEQLGVHNIGVIVVENASRKIRGVIGNFAYLGHAHGQSIASFNVPRSPGSTLKPFLYALALERGMLLPGTLLLDVPTHYAGYAPGNFSGSYLGLVRAEDALSKSLNIPFVRLLHRVGVEHFMSYVEQGVSWRFDRSRGLGLSMIIGGVELTPMQMIELYVNLANHGRSAPLLDLAAAHTGKSTEWFSEGAMTLLGQAMARRDRPDFPDRSDIVRVPSDIRWKTGTSQGRRDAWSIGFDHHYTVLVWLGNLDQTPSQFLTGATAAGPVMFDILEALKPRHAGEVELSSTAGLREVEVCAFSGDPPGPHCPLLRKTMALANSPVSGSCRFHRQVLVDKKTHLRVMKGCDQGMQTELKTVVQLPPMVRRWYGEKGGRGLRVPPFHPACREMMAEQGSLDILAPKDGERLMLLPSFGTSRLVVPLDIESTASPAETTCILNGHQMQTAQGGGWPVLQLAAGDYHLFCSSTQGASDQVSFSIEKVR